MGALVTLPFKRIGKFTKCNTFRLLYVKFLRGRKYNFHQTKTLKQRRSKDVNVVFN